MLKVEFVKSESEVLYFKNLDDFNEYVRKHWFDIEEMRIQIIQLWRNNSE